MRRERPFGQVDETGLPPCFMADGPNTDGVWGTYRPTTSYGPTLFLFAWALLPVGFQVLMVGFQRFEAFRTPLAIAALSLLMVPLVSGTAQRKGAWRTPLVQLSVACYALAATMLGLIWGLGLDDWWWVPHGLTFGCVPMLFLALDHLARCNQPGWERRWDPSVPVPALEALGEWTLVSARWNPAIMAWYRNDLGDVVVMYGCKDDVGHHQLRIEPLMRATAKASEAVRVDWTVLNSVPLPVGEDE